MKPKRTKQSKEEIDRRRKLYYSRPDVIKKVKEKKKIYHAKHREREKLKYDLKKDTKEFKEKKKNSVLKNTYNISLDDYNKMFEDQDGCCKICLIHNSKVNKPLAVDHCHSSGKVRGLLCVRCNMGIGFLKEDIIILKAAIKYIRNNEI